MSDAGAWLWDKIKGLFGGVMDKIKGFFGIRSYSRQFAKLGYFMGEGIGVGFEDAMNKVSKDMQNAIPTTFDEPTVNVRPDGRRGICGSGRDGGMVINQKVSITSPKALSEREAVREFHKLSRRLALEV
jgi:hypothetical protein